MEMVDNARTVMEMVDKVHVHVARGVDALEYSMRMRSDIG